MFLSSARFFLNRCFRRCSVAESQSNAYLNNMANGLMPLVRLCALYLLCVGCSSDHDPDTTSTAGADAGGGKGGSVFTSTDAGKSGEGAGGSSRGGMTASGGVTASAGTLATAGSGGKASGGANGGAPPAVDGHSVYALECHGDSKDCNLAAVPCFGVSSPTPNVAAGWACANRCTSNADCSDAPSGAQARASCVPFSSASHCVLVCKSEDQSFACPDGMGCYVPAKSPIGYCLWQ